MDLIENEKQRILDASQPNNLKVPRAISEMIRLVHQSKWGLIKSRQEANKSYKEICIPLLEKCRFLLYEVKPAVSVEMEAFRKVNVLYKEPRVRTLVKKVLPIFELILEIMFHSNTCRSLKS